MARAPKYTRWPVIPYRANKWRAHARIHKRVPAPLKSLGRVLHQIPNLGTHLLAINTAKIKIHEISLTTDQDIFIYNLRSAIHTF